MKKVVSTGIILTLFAIGVFAAKLKNQDSKRYEIKIIESSTVTNSWIEANTTVQDICSGCEIQIVGDDSETGRITVGKDDVIVIKDGKLSKE